MSSSWKVLASIENAEANRCVDIFIRPDGTFGFEEYRRDPEDAGSWTLVGYHAHHVHATRDEATAAARTVVAWLAN